MYVERERLQMDITHQIFKKLIPKIIEMNLLALRKKAYKINTHASVHQHVVSQE